MEKTMQRFLFILIGLLTRTVTPHKRPHLIFIIADDLGWSDVGWINPDIHTPNLDQLAYKGVILNSSYVQPTCTPSRAAFMTGYYPFHTGLQHGVIFEDQPKYVPNNFTFLPQELKKLGYATHLVGKWHLGFCNKIYTPTYRGFDNFFGFYGGAENHYTHMKDEGYDFRWNDTVYKEAQGNYSTTLFAKHAIEVIEANDPDKQPLFLYLAFQAPHTPLQVPEKYLKQYEHIPNKNRRIYSAMITAMDEAVGNIVTALTENGYMGNLLLVFTSDNGAASHVSGSNWPLRGAKTTLWEGGTRVPGFVFSETLLKKSQYVNNDLVHAVDWFPTLLAAAGGSQTQGIDGLNQWRGLRSGQKSVRTEFIYNIDDVKGHAAIRLGDYKLIRGGSGSYNNWYRPRLQKDCSSVTSRDEKIQCARMKEEERIEEQKLRQPNIQLYNIKEDPLEQNNIAKNNYHIVQKLKRRLEKYQNTLVKANEPPIDPKARPVYYNGVWSPGWC